jgi:pimeloyl-ACP methyl ester carboxylesterase
VILFDNAGVGRSTGKVPESIPVMTKHAIAFLDGLGISGCDVLGFSLGGMIAQQLALDRPSLIRRIILAGTAPRGGEDIMHIEKPCLAQHFRDPNLPGYARLQKLFFAPTESSQSAGVAFIKRLALRAVDRDANSSPEVAKAQIAAFRDWEGITDKRFSDLKRIQQPTLVVHGVHDEMIPIRNSYWLGENLPNAVQMTYPDSAHGSLFQFHEPFARQAMAFLASDSAFAPY